MPSRTPTFAGDRRLAWMAAAVLLANAAAADVHFRNGVLRTERRTASELRDEVDQLASQPNVNHVLVQFDRPPAASDRATLHGAGLVLQRYLGDQAFTAQLDPARLRAAAIASVSSIRDVRLLDPVWKLSPLLASGRTPDWAVVEAGDPLRPVIGAYVLFHEDVPLEPDAVDLINLFDGTVRDRLESVNGLVVELPLDASPALAAEDAVLYVEQALPRLAGNNAENRLVTQADAVQAAPYNLSGAGVSVLVYDVGTAWDGHPDFGGRVTPRDGTEFVAHSTHVAGTVGGSGAASSGLYRGMAPGVTIESYGFEYDGSGFFLYTNPGDLEADYSEAMQLHGASIANNSLGTNVTFNGLDCDITGDYGVTSALIDGIVRGSLGAPFRSIWANGNERFDPRCGNLYHTTAPPACAKNHITVGALNADDETIAFFSSWGPTDDGRIKPDISAPGCQNGGDGGVTSTTYDPVFGDRYAVFCGTSMAAPTVTGIAALLLEDYRQQFPGRSDFRNSTLKSLLVHSAADLGRPGPDYEFGYGSVRARQAVDLLRSSGALEQELLHGERFTLFVDVADAEPELKVTLAWDDAPAVPLVIPSLVNDLDLVVFDPLGNRHYPWTLDPNRPDAPAVREREDHLNNIEQVFVADPIPGVWRAEVRGFNVPDGPQPFSVTASPQPQVAGLLRFEFPEGLPAIAPPGVETRFPVEIILVDDQLVPGSPEIVYSIDGAPTQSAPLIQSADGLHEAVLPPVHCDQPVEFYLSASGVQSGAAHSPPDAPQSTFTLLVGDRVVPADDDMEMNQGWVVGAADDTAIRGVWERVDPQATPAQPEDDHTPGAGTSCWVTDGRAGAGLGDHDVDGGKTTLVSPAYDVSGLTDPVLSYWLWYSNDQGAFAPDDVFSVDISSDDGVTWTNLETVGPDLTLPAHWAFREFHLAAIVQLTDRVRLRFVAEDAGSASIVEAALDDLRIDSLECTESAGPADLNNDCAVDLDDLTLLLQDFGCAGACAGDIDGDGATGLDDLTLLLQDFGQLCP